MAARTHGDGGAIASLRARLAGGHDRHPAHESAPAQHPADPADPSQDSADAPTTELPAARPQASAPPSGAAPVQSAYGELPPPRAASSARNATGTPAGGPASPPVEQADDRDSAIDRLFAPLAESDHTEPIPTARTARAPRAPRQPKP